MKDTEIDCGTKNQSVQSQAIMSQHICYKKDIIQPKLKHRPDVFKAPVSQGENSSELKQREKIIWTQKCSQEMQDV